MNAILPNKFLPTEPDFYDSDEIGGIFFEGHTPIDLMNGRMTIVNESKNFKIPEQYSKPISDSIGEGYMLDETIITAKSEHKLVNYKIFISDDGDKLNYLVNNTSDGRPESNELLIYIEGDSDTFSGKLMHVLSGNEVELNEKPFKYVVKEYTALEDKEINELLESTVQGEESFANKFVFLLTGILRAREIGYNILSSALGKAIKLIDKIKPKESIWNPKKGNSNIVFDTAFNGVDSSLANAKLFLDNLDRKVLKRLNRKNKLIKPIADRLAKVFDKLTNLIDDAITIFAKITKFALGYVQQQLSQIIGVWNGLIDMISGLLFLVKLIIDGGKLANRALLATANFKKDTVRKTSILEQLDNVLDRIRDISFVEVFDKVISVSIQLIGEIDFSALAKSLKAGAGNLGRKAKKRVTAITIYEVSYYIGYIATFFIPVAWIAAVLGKAGKLGKLLGGSLQWVDDIMAKVVGFGLRGLQKAAKPFTALLRALAKKLQGGTQSVLKSIDDVVKGIRKWLDDEHPEWRRKLDDAGDYSRDYAERVSKTSDNLFSQKMKDFEKQIYTDERLKRLDELDAIREAKLKENRKLTDEEIFTEKELLDIDLEDSFVVNKKKNIALRHYGKKYPHRLKWNSSELYKMKGSIVTHNHPTSSGLSLADMTFFLSNGVKEMRAIGRDRTVFSMKANSNLSNKARNDLMGIIKRQEDYWKPLINESTDMTVVHKIIFQKHLWPVLKDYVDYKHFVD